MRVTMFGRSAEGNHVNIIIMKIKLDRTELSWYNDLRYQGIYIYYIYIYINTITATVIRLVNDVVHIYIYYNNNNVYNIIYTITARTIMRDLVFKYNLTINSIKIILTMRGSEMTAAQLTQDIGVSRKTIDRCLQTLLSKDLIEISWIKAHNEKVYQIVGGFEG